MNTAPSTRTFDTGRLPAGSTERKDIPIATGVIDYFPDALAAVAALSKIGNDKHNPGEPLHWAREKSTDHPDCLMRHFIDRGTIDSDGVRHSVKVAWRALAILQLELEETDANDWEMGATIGKAVNDAMAREAVEGTDVPPAQFQSGDRVRFVGSWAYPSQGQQGTVVAQGGFPAGVIPVVWDTSAYSDVPAGYRPWNLERISFRVGDSVVCDCLSCRAGGKAPVSGIIQSIRDDDYCVLNGGDWARLESLRYADADRRAA